ncbi:MAG: AI-2E family transporter [Ruminococcaceae bacterium]|nr:AI-2E family transporter [Oscillospiraceae bacterium]
MTQKDRYVKLGFAVFCTVGAILLFYDTLFGGKALLRFGGELLSAVEPILYGAFMAYLLAPVVNFFEKRLFSTAKKKPRRQWRKVSWGVRALSILLTWAVIGVLLFLLGYVLLPELYKSITQLIANVEAYYTTVSRWLHNLFETYPQLEEWAVTRLDSYFASMTANVQNQLLEWATSLMSLVSGGVFGVIGFFGDLLVGVIVSVYFLATKEGVAAHARKVVCSLFSREKGYWIFRGSRKVDSIFSGFVRGKLLDSLIIGILCFIGCSILRFPYTPLVSVIVGVTNVIPFFGPFLGAIPSIFLILLVSPLRAVYFAIFILGLQQLDGNVIGPAILGEKTGLPSLWVILAILVGGHFFGFVGMFFGVPVCACLYNAATFYVEWRLKKKNMPSDTASYTARPSVAEEKPAEEEAP